MNQDISRSPVAMSGAGMSWSGPITGTSSLAKRRVISLHLGDREAVGVAAHTALGAAERQAQERALEAHPERQRRALAERDAGGVAHAALGRPEREGVLDPVAGEALHLAAVAAHREVDDDRASRLQQAGAGVGVEAKQVGGLVELGDRHPPQLRAPLAAGR